MEGACGCAATSLPNDTGLMMSSGLLSHPVFTRALQPRRVRFLFYRCPRMVYSPTDAADSEV